jgi:NADH dehydrogenase
MHSHRQKIIILGGGYAGLTAAARLAEAGTFDITLIDRSERFTERVRWHEIAAGRHFRSWLYRDMLPPMGVTFLQGDVQSIDPDMVSVRVASQDAEPRELRADHILYALGSSSDRHAIEGLAAHGRVLADAESAWAIHRTLTTLQSPRIAIGGGGLTAIELAAELADARPEANVTLVPGNGLSASSSPGGFHPEAMSHIRKALDRLGVKVLDGALVEAVDAENIRITGGERLRCDLYVHASGFAISDLARKAGIAVDGAGRILADPFLRSLSHPSIFAIGDAAISKTAAQNASRLSCATAMPMGAAVARNLQASAEGRSLQPHVTGYAFRNVSLGRADGVIQFLDNEDRPLADVWTGTKAAKWKEYICQTTLHTIRFASPPKRPAMPPLRLLPHLIQHAKKIA